MNNQFGISLNKPLYAPEIGSLYIPDAWIRDVEQFSPMIRPNQKYYIFSYCRCINCHRLCRLERTLDRIHFPFVTSYNLPWNTLTEAAIKQEWNQTFFLERKLKRKQHTAVLVCQLVGPASSTWKSFRYLKLKC